MAPVSPRRRLCHAGPPPHRPDRSRAGGSMNPTTAASRDALEDPDVKNVRQSLCTTFCTVGATVAIAANVAMAQGQPNCPSEGNCFVQHNSPGCQSIWCCQTVCDFDGWCCQVAWDSVCVSEAL